MMVHMVLWWDDPHPLLFWSTSSLLQKVWWSKEEENEKNERGVRIRWGKRREHIEIKIQNSSRWLILVKRAITCWWRQCGWVFFVVIFLVIVVVFRYLDRCTTCWVNNRFEKIGWLNGFRESEVRWYDYGSVAFGARNDLLDWRGRRSSCPLSWCCSYTPRWHRLTS